LPHVERRFAASLALTLLTVLACEPAESLPPTSVKPSDGPETAWVEIAGELFELELAIDSRDKQRGLSGRRTIAPDGGMLFVNPRPTPSAMVMRDCPVPIDVAFLDATGRVVAIHEMKIEPPRGRDEDPLAYERRLPVYDSGAPAAFAVETAGGRLRALGLAVGDPLVFDADALTKRARKTLP